MNNSKVISATGQPESVEIGIFKLKSYGSLLKRELSWFESQSNQRIKSILPVFELAKKIAVDRSITEEEALSIVQHLDEPENKGLLMMYTFEIADIQNNAYSESSFNADITTMVIQSRVSKKSLSESHESLIEIYDIEVGVDAVWTSQHTEALPISLIDEICGFILRERNGEKPESTTEEVPTLGE